MSKEYEIFNIARTKIPPERTAYLDDVCGQDAALRARVEALLQHHDRPGQQPEMPTAPPEGVGTPEVEPPVMDRQRTDIQDINAAKSPPIAPELHLVLRPSPRMGAFGRLGDYDLMEKIGQGSFGVVYKAVENDLERTVAVKILLASTDRARAKFREEAKRAAAVQHDNIVQIYAASKDLEDNRPAAK